MKISNWRRGMSLDFSNLPPMSLPKKSSLSDSFSDKTSSAGFEEEELLSNKLTQNKKDKTKHDESDNIINVSIDDEIKKDIDIDIELNQKNNHIIKNLKIKEEEEVEEREGKDKKIVFNLNSSGPCSETSHLSEYGKENGRHNNVLNEAKDMPIIMRRKTRLTTEEEEEEEERIDDDSNIGIIGKTKKKKSGTRSTTPNLDSMSGKTSYRQNHNYHSDHNYYYYTKLNHKRAQSAYDFCSNLGDHQLIDEYEKKVKDDDDDDDDEKVRPKSPLGHKKESKISNMKLEGPLDNNPLTSLNVNTSNNMEPEYDYINLNSGTKLKVKTTPTERKLNLNVEQNNVLSLNTNYQKLDDNLNLNDYKHSNNVNCNSKRSGGEKMTMPFESSPTTNTKVMLSKDAKSPLNEQINYTMNPKENLNESDVTYKQKKHHFSMSEIENKKKLQNLKDSFCKLPSSHSNMFNSNTIKNNEKGIDLMAITAAPMNEKSDNLGYGQLDHHYSDDSSENHPILHNKDEKNYATSYELSHDHIKTNESHIEDIRDQNTNIKLVTYDKSHEKSSKSNSTKQLLKYAENKQENNNLKLTEEEVKNKGHDDVMRKMRRPLDLVKSNRAIKLEGLGHHQVIEKEEIKPSLCPEIIRMQNVIQREMGPDEKVERMWMSDLGMENGNRNEVQMSDNNFNYQSLENNNECTDCDDKMLKSECYVRNEKRYCQNYLNEKNDINKLEAPINIENACINVEVDNDRDQMNEIHFNCNDRNQLLLENNRGEEEEEDNRRINSSSRRRRRRGQRGRQQHRFSSNHESLIHENYFINKGTDQNEKVPSKELLRERSRIKRKIQKMMKEKGYEELKHANTVLIENLNFSSNFHSHNVFDILEMNYPKIKKALRCVNVPETLAYILMFDAFNEAKEAQEALDGIRVFGKVTHVHILSDFLVSTLISEHENINVPNGRHLSASDLSTNTHSIMNENYNIRHDIGDIPFMTPTALPILETEEFNENGIRYGNEMTANANSLLYNIMKNELTPESSAMNNHLDQEHLLINEVMKTNKEIKSHKIVMCSESGGSDEGKSSSKYSNETHLSQFDELPEFDKSTSNHNSDILISKNHSMTNQIDTINQHFPLNIKYSKVGISSREKKSSNKNEVVGFLNSGIVVKTPTTAALRKQSQLIMGQNDSNNDNIGQRCHQKLEMSYEAPKLGLRDRIDVINSGASVIKTAPVIHFNRKSISGTNIEEQIRNARNRMTDLKNNLFKKYNMNIDEDMMQQQQQQQQQNRMCRLSDNLKSQFELKVNSSKLNLPIFKKNIGPTIQKTKIDLFFENQQFQAMYILYHDEREQQSETTSHQLTDLTFSKTEFMNAPLTEKTALCLCHIDKNKHLILHGIWTPQLQVSDEKEVNWKRSYKAAPVNLTTSEDIYEIFNLNNDTELMTFLSSPQIKKYVFINDEARLNTMIQLLLQDANEYMAHRSNNRDFQ